MKLKHLVVKNARPNGKTQRLFDGRGLYLEVSPKGGKWWRFKYQFEKKEKRMSLGIYPDISLEMARQRREEARKLVAQGVDPGKMRKAQEKQLRNKAANTFEVIANEWIKKCSNEWVPEYRERVHQRLKQDIFPCIGRTPIGEMTSPKLLEVIRRIEQRGVVETAHRILGVCGRIFRYAIATGHIQNNPCDSLRGALKTAKTKSFASVIEPQKVAQVLRMIDAYDGTLAVQCALRLAPLVFVRPGELRKAEWKDIDLEKGEWKYLVTKTQTPHVVPLARQSIKILKEVQPLTGHGRYVFPSSRTYSRPMSDNALLAAMRRMGISKEELCTHGFRAMARTILDEVLGFRPDFIEHQLAHTVRDPLGRAYNRTKHLQERKEMMQKWANYLDELKGQV